MSTAPRDFASFASSSLDAGVAAAPAASAGALNLRWASLQEAAASIARLAGISGIALDGPERLFPHAMREVGGWRRALAEQGIDDLIAVLESGVAALLALHARGANAQPAAKALWDEFVTARDALVQLAHPPAGGQRALA